MKRLLLACLLLRAAPCVAQNLPYSLPDFPYQGQGPFVIIPGRVAGMPVAQVGFMVGAFICLPGSLVQDQLYHGQTSHDREASIVCGRDLGLALGWPVYAAVGLPFFLLKQAFWTGPRAAWRGLSGSGRRASAP